jgi:hypothetical protein
LEELFAVIENVVPGSTRHSDPKVASETS